MKAATQTFLRKTKWGRQWGLISNRIQELLLVVPKKRSSKIAAVKSTSELFITDVSHYFQNHKKAHLVIIGSTDLEKLVIENVLRNTGVPSDRIVYHLNYLSFKKKSVESLYTTKTDNLFLVGPTPNDEKGRNLWDYLHELFGNKRAVRVESPSGELKIDKDSLREAMMKLF